MILDPDRVFFQGAVVDIIVVVIGIAVMNVLEVLPVAVIGEGVARFVFWFAVPGFMSVRHQAATDCIDALTIPIAILLEPTVGLDEELTCNARFSA